MATRNSSAGKNGALDPALPQKKRARRRLVGAAAVCLVAAIVLPIVLDSEPRHAREDVQVRIPSRDTPLRESENGAVQGVIGGGSRSAPGASGRTQDDEASGEAALDPETEASEGAAASGVAVAAGTAAAVAASNGAGAGASRESASGSGSKTPAKVASSDSTAANSTPKSTTSAAGAAGAPPSLSVPAQPGSLEARPESRLADNRSGFVLQAGAFASEKSAAEQQARVRKAGLKSYTEKVSTSQGPRIRVRVGPFSSREAAEKARATLKASGVESALIAP